MRVMLEHLRADEIAVVVEAGLALHLDLLDLVLGLAVLLLRGERLVAGAQQARVALRAGLPEHVLPLVPQLLRGGVVILDVLEDDRHLRLAEIRELDGHALTTKQIQIQIVGTRNDSFRQNC